MVNQSKARKLWGEFVKNQNFIQKNIISLSQLFGYYMPGISVLGYTPGGLMAINGTLNF